MRWHVVESLGDKQGLTPEGFLLCRDVAIARTGTQIYHHSEIPGLVPNHDGLLRIDRDASEVFRPDSISSFEGKPVVNDHPMEDVTPANWRALAIGHVANVRRGSGADADVLLADLLITDQGGIDAIRAGKRAVSVGYDAHYSQIADGHGKQSNIVCNHVALVDVGRCGARCTIGDSGEIFYSHTGTDDADERPAWDADIDWRDDFNEPDHPRGGKGSSKGGQFVKKGEGGGGGGGEAEGAKKPAEKPEGKPEGKGEKGEAPAPAAAAPKAQEKKQKTATHQRIEREMEGAKPVAAKLLPEPEVLTKEQAKAKGAAILEAAGATELAAGAKAKLAAAGDNDTKKQFFDEATQTWDPARVKLQQDIVEKLFFKPEDIARARPAPGETPTMVVLGGRGGSGKTWLTNAAKGGPVDKNKFIVVDSDEIKKKLPEYEGWNAALVHEEADHMIAMAQDYATGLGLNIVHDATIKSRDSVAERVAHYIDKGYEVEGHYMFCPPEEACRRAMGRYARGGETGRYVPPEVILGNTHNERNFDGLIPQFKRWTVYDNSVEGRNPQFVAGSEGEGSGKPAAKQVGDGHWVVRFNRRLAGRSLRERHPGHGDRSMAGVGARGA